MCISTKALIRYFARLAMTLAFLDGLGEGHFLTLVSTETPVSAGLIIRNRPKKMKLGIKKKREGEKVCSTQF